MRSHLLTEPQTPARRGGRSIRLLLGLLAAGAITLAGAPAARAGVLFLSGDDAEEHCPVGRCGDLYSLALRAAVDSSRTGGAGILAIGVNGGAAESVLRAWNVSMLGPNVPITILTDSVAIASVRFEDYLVVYMPTDQSEITGGIRAVQIAALAARRDALERFVNESGGSLVAMSQSGLANGYSWLPVPLEFQKASNVQVVPTQDLLNFIPDATAQSLSHDRYHAQFPGPPGFAGLKVLARAADDGTPVILGFEGGAVGAGPVCTVSPRLSYDVAPGDTLRFRVAGAHPAGANVVLEESGLPVAAIATPSFPVSGSGTGASSDVTWIPSAADVGTHQVRFVARAGEAVSAPCEVRIVVRSDADRVPPRLTCPSNIHRVVPAGEEAVAVSFDVTAVDDLDPAPRVTCTPPSGSMFRVGRTRVLCETVDRSGNRSTCGFVVVVEDRASGSGGIVVSILGDSHVVAGVTNSVQVVVENRGDTDAGPIPVVVTFPAELAVTLETPTGEVIPGTAGQDADDPLGAYGPEGFDAIVVLNRLEAGGRMTIEFKTRLREDAQNLPARSEIRALATPIPFDAAGTLEDFVDCASEWLFFGAGAYLKKRLGNECAASFIKENAKLLFDAYYKPEKVYKASSFVKYAIENAAACQDYLEPIDSNPLELSYAVLELAGAGLKFLSRAERIVNCLPLAGRIVSAVASLVQYFTGCVVNGPDLGSTIGKDGGRIDIELGHPGFGVISEIEIEVEIVDGAIGPGGEACVGGDCNSLDGGNPIPGGEHDGSPGWTGCGRSFDPHWELPGIGRWYCEKSPDESEAHSTIDAVDPATGEPRAEAPDGVLPGGTGRQTLYIRPNPTMRTGDRIRVTSEVHYHIADSTVAITRTAEATVDLDGPSVHFTRSEASEDGRRIYLEWDGQDPASGIRSYTILQSLDGGSRELIHAGGPERRSLEIEVGRVGDYEFRLEATDRIGNRADGDEAHVLVRVPGAAAFTPGLPGRGEQEIRFGVPRSSRVRVDLYDVRGRLIRRLLDEPRDAGWSGVTWDGRQDSGRASPPGVYFARVRIGEAVLAVRLVRLGA